ncbi:MAG: leucyl aminopeptidase family protein [Proteobacteria bacterium]|nr:leucyl aminopeptidase family protein [Pseudomonadota bacterium]
MSPSPSAVRRNLVLPTEPAPALSSAAAGAADKLDVVLAIVTLPLAAGALRALPRSTRWQQLHARAPARAGTVRSGSLGNARDTLMVLGYAKAEASAFERLTLAARMLKEAAARHPRSMGLCSTGKGTAATGLLEALIAASLACAFELPSIRAPAHPEGRLQKLVLLGEHSVDTRRATAVARGTNLTRWLTALPPNVLDARGYRQAIARLARAHDLKLTWLDERALKRAGAGAFLAVAQGNHSRDAGIAHLQYRPARRARGGRADVALIGKGILFDTGGVNLKPHRSMLEMHTDMSGSAVALATLVALAELRAPLAADAWLAITENNIGPHAYRPQEVVRAANGVTIQVVHTDAEGRMVLADTLALAARTQPRFMMDFATLTGACVHALTERMSGVFANRPALAQALYEAGRASGERVWAFPFEEDFDADLESKVADIIQCTVDGKGDHILATRFLSRFVPAEIPWAHVDLSASTRTGGLAHVATEVTGFGARLALELLLGPGLRKALEAK